MGFVLYFVLCEASAPDWKDKEVGHSKLNEVREEPKVSSWHSLPQPSFNNCSLFEAEGKLFLW